MIWEKNVKLIVMTCELIEGQSKKCFSYWPKLSSSNRNNELNLNNGYKISAITEKNVTNNLTERNFLITNSNNEKKEVTQIHFRKWPDHGVPDLVETFETFEKINEIINYYGPKYKNSPIVVHCSAGVGRTGTVISIFQIYYIAKKHLEKNIKNWNLNIFNIARRLKEQRRYMIQTSIQYELIYKFSYIMFKKMALEFKR